MKKPVKYRILEYAVNKNSIFSLREITDIMMAEYPGEKTAELKQVRKQLDMFCGIGVLNAVNIRYDEDEMLVYDYIISKAGIDCFKNNSVSYD